MVAVVTICSARLCHPFVALTGEALSFHHEATMSDTEKFVPRTMLKLF